MKVLVVNCGSSSLKYQLIDMSNESVLAQGLVERIGSNVDAIFTHKRPNAEKYTISQPMENHKVALTLVLNILADPEYGVVKSMDEIAAVGHRVLHGGMKFAKSVVIDEAVIEAIKECIPLGPLHNPANLQGIEACQAIMPNTPQVAVFDTAFHQTMPAENYVYALPYEMYEKHGIRKYGFHGTSHRYVARRVAEIMGKKPEDVNVIICHLGNGSSMSAVKAGKCFDTSMGFTPLAGVPMGTRCGDIDPAIVIYLQDKLGMSPAEVDTLMNKKSGVLGISGVSNDFRLLEEAAEEGNERAQLALDMFHTKVRATIGAYAAELGHVDAIAFTAGIGENGIDNRAAICKGLEVIGAEFDAELNKVRGEEREFSKPGSKVKLFVVPTNEELTIARDTVELTK